MQFKKDEAELINGRGRLFKAVLGRIVPWAFGFRPSFGLRISDFRFHPVWVLGLLLALPAVGAESFVKSAEDRARIEQAVPNEAIVKPAKPRRLLIFTLNVGYPGHASIAYANEAFTLMGKRTGAFETTVSQDPDVFQRDSLQRFDAVFFNNNVGNCFTNAELRRNLLEFITGGGGLLGVHGTTVAFTHWPGAIEDWPEFGFLIGARGANHKDSDEHVWLKLDDPNHPINQVFEGQQFEYRDEFFRPQGTYSRDRVRVLLSIDTTRTDVNKGQARGNCFRADNDYAAAWVRSYGRGRVFYTTIAHNPYVFYDAKMLRFYLAAIQFALGDLPCPTTPSSKLTPAVRAQEKLGWHLSAQAGNSGDSTLFEDIETASRLGIPYLSASDSQMVSKDLAKRFNADLTDLDLEAVRLKLEEAGLRLLTYTIREIPTDQDGWRKSFEFGRKMGIETLICPLNSAAVALAEPLFKEYHIQLASDNHMEKAGAGSARLKAINDRGQGIGTCGDLDEWQRLGLNPVRATRALKEKLIVVRLGSLETNATDSDRARALNSFLNEVQRLNLKPIFLVELRKPDSRTVPPGEVIRVFNEAMLASAQARK
jgi:type 1 glutamine amidotransferase